MSQQEFTDAVARVPALWGRKIVTILEVTDGRASVRVYGMVSHFWVPVEKLERVGHKPAKPKLYFDGESWGTQPVKRSGVC